ncbi:hypothetical protein A9Q81_14315 [Gammaproteobacteria bacterium 42_54_T18]|nr:hypothetical protein A9Q81_14315 [Gammaproteobacteria bacterium 42_54_T18]
MGNCLVMVWDVLRSLLQVTLVLLVITLLISSVYADPVRVSVDEAYPPYMYDSNDVAMGLYPDVVAAIFTRIGRDTSISALPWKRALRFGESGLGGVAGIYKNQERLTIYDYSDPLYEERLVLYVKKGRSFDFSNITDLKGKKVGLNFGWSYGDVIDSARKAELFEADDSVKNNLANFRKLIGERTDCFIVDELAARRIIAQQGFDGLVEQLDIPVSVNAGYLVFSKTLRQKGLIDEFNKAMEELRLEGAYEVIVESVIQKP